MSFIEEHFASRETGKWKNIITCNESHRADRMMHSHNELCYLSALIQSNYTES